MRYVFVCMYMGCVCVCLWREIDFYLLVHASNTNIDELCWNCSLKPGIQSLLRHYRNTVSCSVPLLPRAWTSRELESRAGAWTQTQLLPWSTWYPNHRVNCQLRQGWTLWLQLNTICMRKKYSRCLINICGLMNAWEISGLPCLYLVQRPWENKKQKVMTQRHAQVTDHVSWNVALSAARPGWHRLSERLRN